MPFSSGTLQSQLWYLATPKILKLSIRSLSEVLGSEQLRHPGYANLL